LKTVDGANARHFSLAGVALVDSSIKADARRLVERLPPDATWEDLQYEIYVRQAVEAGLKDAREGRTVSLDEVRRRFGLKGP
jgi:hypothetical protein